MPHGTDSGSPTSEGHAPPSPASTIGPTPLPRDRDEHPTQRPRSRLRPRPPPPPPISVAPHGRKDVKVDFTEADSTRSHPLAHSSSFFAKRDAAGGGTSGPPSPNDRSPLAMLMRSFAYPVSEEQALNDSIRITLGHEPEEVPLAAATGSSGSGAVHTNNSGGAAAHISPLSYPIAAGGESSRALNRSFGGTAAPAADLSNAGSISRGGANEHAVPTRRYSGLQQHQHQQHHHTNATSSTAPSSTGAAGEASRAAPARPHDGADSTGHDEDAGDGGSSSTHGRHRLGLLGSVVPKLDATQANNGLPGEEHGVALMEGESYVFRHNIRVSEPPPPALLASDPALLAIIGHAVATCSTRGFRGGSSSDARDRNPERDDVAAAEGGGGPSEEPQPQPQAATAAATCTDQQAVPHHLPYGGGGGAGAAAEQHVFSPHEPATESEEHDKHNQRRSTRSSEAAPAADAGGNPAASRDGTSSSSSFSKTPQLSAPHPRHRCLSAEESAPVDEKAARRHAKQHPPKAPPPPSAAETTVAVAEPRTQTYLTTGSFHAAPILMDDVQRERIIVDCFNTLSSETRRLELLEAFYIAHMQPYEGRDSFTGDNWDDVMTRQKVDSCFSIRFDDARYCFYVTAFRHEHRVFLFSFLLRCLCIFLFWVLMFCMLPRDYFYPGSLYFDTLTTILFAGIVGTLAARLINIPTLIGALWAGILWNNVPYTGRLTKGITADIRQFISLFGLSIGIIRAGLSLNVIRFKQKFKYYIAFSIIPMAAEMVVHGVCAKAIYKLPNYRWAFAEGFLLSSIAPSVVVPIIITYQRRGYGVKDGPPMMMLCSIAVDTAICLWGIQFLLALEFQTMSATVLIVLAPMQVVVGLVGGVLLGFLVFIVTFYVLFMEAERLPEVRTNRLMTLRHSVHVRYISIGFMVLVSFTCVSIGKRFSCIGGSAIGVVAIAGTFNYLCVRGGTQDHLRVKSDMAQTLTTVWDYLAMPALFGLSGATIDVHELFAREFIGQAFGLVFIGMGTRAVMAMLVPLVMRLGLSWPELVFCAVGWIGKGSVQGSMAATAQGYATQELAAATTPEQVARAQERIEFGIKMKNAAILGILVACPLCSIFLVNFTSKLLKKGT